MHKDGTLFPSILLWTLGVWLIRNSTNGNLPHNKRKTAQTGLDETTQHCSSDLACPRTPSLLCCQLPPLLLSQGATCAPQCLLELFCCLTRLSCLKAASNKHFFPNVFLNIKISIRCNFPSNPTLPKPKLKTKATRKSRLPAKHSNPDSGHWMWNCP